VFTPAFGAGAGGNDVALGFFDAVRSMGLLGLLDVLASLPDPMPEPVLAEARANWTRQDDAAMRACVTALADAVLLDDIAQLARVDVPTLVVGHRDDPLHPWWLAEAYAEALPHARLVGFDAPAAATHARMADLVVDFFTEL
jgi:pimeloyl-ACP methyl ester carboxylesterase